MICNNLKHCCAAALSGAQSRHCQNSDTCIISSDTRQTISCEENNRKYQLENTLGNRIVHYRVDGGIIKGTETLKCDRLLVTCGDKCVSILVELKGNDIAHGIEQITATLDVLSQFFYTCKRVHARIVATKVAPIFMASVKPMRLKEWLWSKYGHGTLEVKSRQFTEKDTDLL